MPPESAKLPDKWALFRSEMKIATRMKEGDRPFFTGTDGDGGREGGSLRRLSSATIADPGLMWLTCLVGQAWTSTARRSGRR